MTVKLLRSGGVSMGFGERRRRSGVDVVQLAQVSMAGTCGFPFQRQTSCSANTAARLQIIKTHASPNSVFKFQAARSATRYGSPFTLGELVGLAMLRHRTVLRRRRLLRSLQTVPVQRRRKASCEPACSVNADVSISVRPEDPRAALEANKPVSVNYFPSRECNYKYGFCFHTETTSYILPIDEIMRGLRLLRAAGLQKLNIAGGEPFLHPKLLTQMIRYCKEEPGLKSISIVSNGSKIQEKWMRDNAKWLYILAISCNSFNPETNIKIRRGSGGGNVDRLFQIAKWCTKYDVVFKLNTVVNTYGWDEDMVANIKKLAPRRWKVFQCLIVGGESDDATRKRDARKFLVTDEQWKTFCDRHEDLECYIPEDNKSMTSSYLNLDEYMCFPDKGEGMIEQSKSLLDVGVTAAMAEVRFDKEASRGRQGIYWDQLEMQKTVGGCGGAGHNKDLEF
jgi:radical S-adenosyl methionine domain-containing protein 2